jgi:hypothetical protein
MTLNKSIVSIPRIPLNAFFLCLGFRLAPIRRLVDPDLIDETGPLSEIQIRGGIFPSRMLDGEAEEIFLINLVRLPEALLHFLD